MLPSLADDRLCGLHILIPSQVPSAGRAPICQLRWRWYQRHICQCKCAPPAVAPLCLQLRTSALGLVQQGQQSTQHFSHDAAHNRQRPMHAQCHCKVCAIAKVWTTESCQLCQQTGSLWRLSSRGINDRNFISYDAHRGQVHGTLGVLPSPLQRCGCLLLVKAAWNWVLTSIVPMPLIFPWYCKGQQMSGLHAPQAHHSRTPGTMASLHHGPSISLRSTRPAAPGAMRATVRSCHGRSQLLRARAVSCRAARELEQLQGVRVVKASSPNEEVELLSLWQVGIFPATRSPSAPPHAHAGSASHSGHACILQSCVYGLPSWCLQWFQWLCARSRPAPCRPTCMSPHLMSFSISDIQEQRKVLIYDRSPSTC